MNISSVQSYRYYVESPLNKIICSANTRLLARRQGTLCSTSVHCSYIQMADTMLTVTSSCMVARDTGQLLHARQTSHPSNVCAIVHAQKALNFELWLSRNVKTILGSDPISEPHEIYSIKNCKGRIEEHSFLIHIKNNNCLTKLVFKCKIALVAYINQENTYI